MSAKSRKGNQNPVQLQVLVVAATLIAVVMVISLSGRTYHETRKASAVYFNRQQSILAHLAAKGIETFIMSVNDDLFGLSELPVVQKMEPGILIAMKSAYERFPKLTSLRRVDRNGILRFIYPNEGWRGDLIGRDYSEDAYFIEANKIGEVAFSDFITNEKGNRCIRIARPVFIEDGKGGRKFNGLIIGSFDIKQVHEVYIAPIVSGETGYAWLLNNKGVLLAHYETEFVGRDTFTVRTERNPDISYEAINRIQRKMLAGKEGVDRYVSGWHRKQKGRIEKLIAYAPVHINGRTWSVAVCAPVSEVEDAIHASAVSHAYTLSFSILVLLVGGATFFLISHRWTRSLEREVTQKTRELSKEVEQTDHLLHELGRKNEELEQIVYITSHDLRSPLVNIQGYSKELDLAVKELETVLNSDSVSSEVREKLSAVLKEDIPEALRYIHASTSKMEALISGLLRLSRVGRAALSIEDLDMNKLVSDVLATLEFQIRDAGATVETGELPPCRGDEAQINQVFSNLIGNALKFLDPERPGVIRISGREEEGLATYCVEDNGTGIAPKQHKRIFEIFHRVDPDATGGEGLGLAIVRKIVEKHRGTIRMESEPGKGSRFSISLRLQNNANEVSKETEL